MACKGVVQHALKVPCLLPLRAAWKTCVSPWVFQDLARASEPHLLRSPRTSCLQKWWTVSQRAPCRTFYGSAKALEQVMRTEKEQSDEGHVSEAKTDKGENSRKPVLTSSSTTRAKGPTELREAVKESMRRVPQPVAIVTATDTSIDSKEAHDTWRGATISSFNTVTLDPEPVVSFNIKKLSSTFDAIEASGRFWVHFLTLEHSSARLAQRFTQRNSDSLFSALYVGMENDEISRTTVRIPKIVGYHRSGAKGLAPQIAFVLDCLYLKDKTVSIGDHVVLFGTVMEISTTTPSSTCLVYADRAYHGLRHLEKPIVRKVDTNWKRG